MEERNVGPGAVPAEQGAACTVPGFLALEQQA